MDHNVIWEIMENRKRLLTVKSTKTKRQFRKWLELESKKREGSGEVNNMFIVSKDYLFSKSVENSKGKRSIVLKDPTKRKTKAVSSFGLEQRVLSRIVELYAIRNSQVRRFFDALNTESNLDLHLQSIYTTDDAPKAAPYYVTTNTVYPSMNIIIPLKGTRKDISATIDASLVCLVSQNLPQVDVRKLPGIITPFVNMIQGASVKLDNLVITADEKYLSQRTIAEVSPDGRTLYLHWHDICTLAALNSEDAAVFLSFLRGVIEGHEFEHVRGLEEEPARAKYRNYFENHRDHWIATRRVVLNPQVFDISVDEDFRSAIFPHSSYQAAQEQILQRLEAQGEQVEKPIVIFENPRESDIEATVLIRARRDQDAKDVLTSLLVPITQGRESTLVITSMPKRFGWEMWRLEHSFVGLVRQVAKQLKLEFINDNFLEIRRRESLTNFSETAQRLEQVKGVAEYRGRLDGKTVILVDDVISSGASIQTAADLLKKAGAQRVIPVIFVKSPEGDPLWEKGNVRNTTRTYFSGHLNQFSTTEKNTMDEIVGDMKKDENLIKELQNMRFQTRDRSAKWLLENAGNGFTWRSNEQSEKVESGPGLRAFLDGFHKVRTLGEKGRNIIRFHSERKDSAGRSIVFEGDLVMYLSEMLREIPSMKIVCDAISSIGTEIKIGAETQQQKVKLSYRAMEIVEVVVEYLEREALPLGQRFNLVPPHARWAERTNWIIVTSDNQIVYYERGLEVRDNPHKFMVYGAEGSPRPGDFHSEDVIARRDALGIVDEVPLIEGGIKKARLDEPGDWKEGFENDVYYYRGLKPYFEITHVMVGRVDMDAAAYKRKLEILHERSKGIYGAVKYCPLKDLLDQVNDAPTREELFNSTMRMAFHRSLKRLLKQKIDGLNKEASRSPASSLLGAEWSTRTDWVIVTKDGMIVYYKRGPKVTTSPDKFNLFGVKSAPTSEGALIEKAFFGIRNMVKLREDGLKKAGIKNHGEWTEGFIDGVYCYHTQEPSFEKSYVMIGNVEMNAKEFKAKLDAVYENDREIFGPVEYMKLQQLIAEVNSKESDIRGKYNSTMRMVFDQSLESELRQKIAAICGTALEESCPVGTSVRVNRQGEVCDIPIKELLTSDEVAGINSFLSKVAQKMGMGPAALVDFVINVLRPWPQQAGHGMVGLGETETRLTRRLEQIGLICKAVEELRKGKSQELFLIFTAYRGAPTKGGGKQLKISEVLRISKKPIVSGEVLKTVKSLKASVSALSEKYAYPRNDLIVSQPELAATAGVADLSFEGCVFIDKNPESGTFEQAFEIKELVNKFGREYLSSDIYVLSDEKALNGQAREIKKVQRIVVIASREPDRAAVCDSIQRAQSPVMIANWHVRNSQECRQRSREISWSVDGLVLAGSFDEEQLLIIFDELVRFNPDMKLMLVNDSGRGDSIFVDGQLKKYNPRINVFAYPLTKNVIIKTFATDGGHSGQAVDVTVRELEASQAAGELRELTSNETNLWNPYDAALNKRQQFLSDTNRTRGAPVATKVFIEQVKKVTYEAFYNPKTQELFIQSPVFNNPKFDLEAILVHDLNAQSHQENQVVEGEFMLWRAAKFLEASLGTIKAGKRIAVNLMEPHTRQWITQQTQEKRMIDWMLKPEVAENTAKARALKQLIINRTLALGYDVYEAQKSKFNEAGALEFYQETKGRKNKEGREYLVKDIV
ncbi:MAG: phosphoribosyltransferase, partial [Candidatus Omnitrophota bacterium]